MGGRVLFVLFFFVFFTGETKTEVKPLKVHQRLRAERETSPRVYPKLSLHTSILFNILRHIVLLRTESFGPGNPPIELRAKVYTGKSAGACNSWGRHSVNVSDTLRCTAGDDYGGKK